MTSIMNGFRFRVAMEFSHCQCTPPNSLQLEEFLIAVKGNFSNLTNSFYIFAFEKLFTASALYDYDPVRRTKFKVLRSDRAGNHVEI